MRFLLAFAIVVATSPLGAQSDPGQGGDQSGAVVSQEALQRAAKRLESIIDAEKNGIEVRIKDIARFRGVRSNQLLGYGLVVGLEGTGDTKNTPFTQTLLANAMKFAGTAVDPNFLKVKNVAVVAITAELPPFSTPGNRIDVTVQSIGDAKSLQGGTLLQAPLYAANSKDVVYAAAQGSVSIGGFNVGSGGNSVQKNHSTVGRIPSGAFVETAVSTQTVFDGKLFLELDEADLTTSKRVAEKIASVWPEYLPRSLTAGTIELNLPPDRLPIESMSEIELLTVRADTAALVVINERTGTIVVGGNVRLGPAVVAKGSLNVRIETDLLVSQPAPFSKGETAVVPQTRVDAREDQAQVALIAPTATVADLAKLFQALRVSPTDIIAILQALQEQGSLKARIKVQ